MLFEDSTVLKFAFNGTIWDIVAERGWVLRYWMISLLSLCAPHSVWAIVGMPIFLISEEDEDGCS
jgi:hypothetical protein